MNSLDGCQPVAETVAELRRPVAGCLVNHDLKLDNDDRVRATRPIRPGRRRTQAELPV